MVSSPVDVANMALSHLGLSVEIQDLQNEKSKEAQACRRFYDNVRDQALRDFPWPFATTFASLALVAEDPTTEWQYGYRVPSDLLRIRRLLPSGGRVDTPGLRVVYRGSQDTAGGLIYTDQVSPVWLEYTAKVTDTERYPPDLVSAISLLLAVNIAPRITSGDQFKLGDRAALLYRWRWATATANAANEMEPDVPVDSEFIRARE